MFFGTSSNPTSALNVDAGYMHVQPVSFINEILEGLRLDTASTLHFHSALH